MSNWDHKKHTDEELKKIVRDVYDCKLFTSLHLKGHDSYLLGSIFMPTMFIGAGPTEPSLVSDNQINRKNKLRYIEEKLQYEKETPEREDFMKNIGMLYEENSKAGPRGINGYPIFMSCQILSIEDTNRFLDLYKRYEKMREEFENEF